MVNKKLGLVLGGGAAKGLAHIGVLRVLEKNNIKVDVIAGTSMGAVIGALYSYGYSLDEIENMFEDISSLKLIDYRVSTKGLLKGDSIEDYLEKYFGDKKFKDLKIPLYVVATDLNNAKKVVFSKGNLAKAIRASISVPGFLEPVENRNRVLVDGFLVDNLPIEVLSKKGVKKIIAVNLYGELDKKTISDKAEIKAVSRLRIPNIFRIIVKSFSVMERNHTKSTIDKFEDAVVLSPKLNKIGHLDFGKMKIAIRKGRNCARKNLRKIKKLVGK